jgi:hypothetical protein
MQQISLQAAADENAGENEGQSSYPQSEEIPQLNGHLLGITMQAQPLSDLPVSFGGYLRERMLKDGQKEAQMSGVDAGVELNAWYPHQSFEPFILLGLGFWGENKLNWESAEHTLGPEVYEVDSKKYKQHRSLQAGLGVRMPSSDSLSAYIQMAFGQQITAGSWVRKAPLEAGLVPLDTAPFGSKELTFRALTQSILIGIDYRLL